jgi:hypothetical protein
VVVVGLWVVAEPTSIPRLPQVPEYQYQSAPVSIVPPVILSIDDIPEHIDDCDEFKEADVIEFVLTVKVVLTHVVVLQMSSALTKYIVVDIGFLIIVLPEPSIVPPHSPEYHSQLPSLPVLPPVRLMVVAAPEQIEEGVAKVDVAEIANAFIVTRMLIQVVVLHVPDANK